MTDLVGNNLKINDSSGNRTVSLYGETANLRLGGKKADGTDGNAGDILLFPKDGDHAEAEAKTVAIKLHGESRSISLSSKVEKVDGTQTTEIERNIRLDGKNGKISLQGSSRSTQSGPGLHPVLFLTKEINLDSETSSLTLKKGGNIFQGEMFIDDSTVKSKNREGKYTVYINGNHPDGGHGAMSLAGADGSNTIYLHGGKGEVALKNQDSKTTIHLDGGAGNIRLGDILLFPKSATISTTNPAQATIHLDGNAGDILLQNADCAEDFDVSVLAAAEPGTVMVINEEGSLRPSTEAYDKKVAGVISGAGDLKPGMVLDRQPGQNARMPVALMGKVYCKVDAQYAPIEVGDLLTTSPTEGHAMKATDPAKAFGAVIGKALKPCEAGKGLIPIIVALQ